LNPRPTGNLMSDKVFIYWDNSNIFHEAQRLAEERKVTPLDLSRRRVSGE